MTAASRCKNHIFRFGAGLNHIQGGGFAEFLGSGPAVGANSGIALPCIAAGNCPDPAGGVSDPLNYPVQTLILGNGEGFSSAKKAFGFPGGGLGPDNRLSLYFGDSWKIRPNFTVTLGLRYARDTGRTDSDLGPTPALNQFDNQFYSGLGNRVNQPNANFAPQLGFAWDAGRNGKTVFRGGIGLFYENSIWNNILFDPAGRLQKGFFLAITGVCSAGASQGLPFTSSIDPATICNQPIGNSQVPRSFSLQQEYQAATVAAGAANNPSYVGTTDLSGIDINETSLLAPDYKSTRSVQMNLGMQREIKRGMVLTVDYLRNVSTHNLLSIDTNHVGDARFFNTAAANAAVATTLANCGVSTIAQTYSGPCTNDPSNPSDPNWGTALEPRRPATIVDFSANGLDSGYVVCGGGPCPQAAFGGVNNGTTGANQMLFPIGRSVYNGLQMSLKEDIHPSLRAIKYMNLQVSYSLSRYVATARDSDFINFPTDYANPLAAMGPNGLDRTHQLSFGGVMDLPAHFRLSMIGHFDSPLAANLTLPVSGLGGGIYQTDLTGDGTGDGTVADNGGLGDLLPGTKLGSFGRDVSVSDLNQLISHFNTTRVGTPTPAGQVLLSHGFHAGGFDRSASGDWTQPIPPGAARCHRTVLAEDLRPWPELGLQDQRQG